MAPCCCQHVACYNSLDQHPILSFRACLAPMPGWNVLQISLDLPVETEYADIGTTINCPCFLIKNIPIGCCPIRRRCVPVIYEYLVRLHVLAALTVVNQSSDGKCCTRHKLYYLQSLEFWVRHKSISTDFGGWRCSYAFFTNLLLLQRGICGLLTSSFTRLARCTCALQILWAFTPRKDFVFLSSVSCIPFRKSFIIALSCKTAGALQFRCLSICPILNPGHELVRTFIWSLDFQWLLRILWIRTRSVFFVVIDTCKLGPLKTNLSLSSCVVDRNTLQPSMRVPLVLLLTEGPDFGLQIIQTLAPRQ